MRETMQISTSSYRKPAPADQTATDPLAEITPVVSITSDPIAVVQGIIAEHERKAQIQGEHSAWRKFWTKFMEGLSVVYH